MKLKDIKKSFALKPNYYLIPVYRTSDPDDFNSLVDEVKKLKGFKQVDFVRTPSKGLCTDTKTLWSEMPGYEIKKVKNGCEVLVLSYELGHFRIQFRSTESKKVDERKVHGRTAFTKFKKDCQKNGIDLEAYKVDEDTGWEIKQTIENPKIDVFSPLFLNRTYYSVHHLDINSSYPAGLAESHPEFRPLIEKYYNKRKENEDYKAILNLTIGFMQSRYCDYAYSQLSKDAIHVNNRKVEEMTLWLQKHDRIVLAWNTDGIWFAGESLADVYHSSELGEWHQDYTNCQFRMRSKGSYEFICDDKYYARVRGKTTYEKEVKPRDQWEWGDIYREEAEAIKYTVGPDYHIYEVKNEK